MYKYTYVNAHIRYVCVYICTNDMYVYNIYRWINITRIYLNTQFKHTGTYCCVKTTYIY